MSAPCRLFSKEERALAEAIAKEAKLTVVQTMALMEVWWGKPVNKGKPFVKDELFDELVEHEKNHATIKREATPRELYQREFNVIEQAQVNETIVSLLEDAIEDEAYKVEDELDKELERAQQVGDTYTEAEVLKKLIALADPEYRVKMAVSHTTLKSLIATIYNNIADKINDEDEEVSVRNSYYRLINHFNEAFKESLPELETRLSLRISGLSNTLESIESLVNKDAEEKELNEAIEGKDEKNSDATKAFEGSIAREDPRNTTSAIVKRFLAGIYKTNSEGDRVQNMFGTDTRIKANTAYVTLVNILSQMKNADEYMVTDDEGNVHFPLLEDPIQVGRYPWLNDVVEELINNEQLRNALYHDMQRVFTEYWVIKDGQPMAVNSKNAIESTIKAAHRNVDNGIILDEDMSLYNKDGSVNMTHGKALYTYARGTGINIARIGNVLKDGGTPSEENVKETAKSLASVFKCYGFEVSESDMANLLKTKESCEELKTLIGYITSDITQIKKIDKNAYTYFNHIFNATINSIANTVAVVSDVNDEITFKQNGSSRPSFTAPCYVDKIMQYLSDISPEKRRAFIDKEFKPYDWFYDKSTDRFRNKFLQDLYDDGKKGNNLAHDFKKITMLEIDGLDYTDWTPGIIDKALIGMFKDVKEGELAYFGMPIYSDSPCLDMVRMRRLSEDEAIDRLVDLGMQELTRISMIEKREAKRQAYEDWIRGGKKGAEPEKVYEIQNFDTKYHYDESTGTYVRDDDKGAKFQFIPELNDILKDDTDKDGNITAYGIQSLIKNGASEQDIREIIKDVINRKFVGEGVDDYIEQLRDDLSIDLYSDLYSEFFGENSLVALKEDYEEANKTNFTSYQEAMEDPGFNRVVREALKNKLKAFYVNDAYYRATMIQLTVTDYAFFKNPVDFQKRYKQVYAAGQRLNTNARLGKKTEYALYIQEEEAISNSIDEIRESLRERGVSEDVIETTMKAFSQTEVANAQAWRTPRSFKSLMDMMGKLTPEMEEAIDRLLDGSWTKADYEMMLQVVKPFVFSQNSTDSQVDGFGKIKVANQHKNSETIMVSFLNAMTKGLNMADNPKVKALYDFMEANGIDVAHNTEAIKCGGQGIINLKYVPEKFAKLPRTENGKIKITNDVEVSGDTYDDFYNDCKKLVRSGAVPYKVIKPILDKIRPDYEDTMKILKEATRKDVEGIENVSTMTDNEGNPVEFNSAVVHSIDYDDYMIAAPTPPHHMDCEAIFGSQLRNLSVADLPEDIEITVAGQKLKGKAAIIKRYNELIEANYQAAFDKVSKKFENIETLQRFLISQIEGNPKYNRDMLNALEIVDELDADGNPTGKKRFNIPLCAPSIKIKLEELMLAAWKKQVTVQKIHGAALIQSAAFGYDNSLKLKFDKNGKLLYMECYMPATSKKMIEKYWNPATKTLDYSKMDDSLKKAIGTRIPTEGKYSMAPLKIVGFLPQSMGSTIMLPTDITTLSGSDFDVDKMFVMLKELEEVFDKDAAHDAFVKDKNKPEKQTFSEWLAAGHYEEFNDLKAIKSDPNKAAKDLTRAQRNNELIDILHGILTSREAAPSFFKPQSFDELKDAAKNSLKLQYLRDVYEQCLVKKDFSELRKLTGVEINPNDSLASMREVYKKIPSLKIKGIDKKLNPISASSFSYFHKQNMTGGKLIGIYANNTVTYAKCQGVSELGLHYEGLSYNGKKITTFTEQKDMNGKNISDNCAQFSAASVDNVKDPVLAKLFQDMGTAKYACAMLRLGFPIEEISLFFTAPAVRELFYMDQEKGMMKITNEAKKVLEANARSIVRGSIPKIEINKGDFVNAAFGYESRDFSNFVAFVVAFADELTAMTKSFKADSPNGAMEHTTGGVLNQLWNVDKMKDFKFIKGAASVVNNDEEATINPLVSRVQSAYQNGIKKAWDTTSKFFIEGTDGFRKMEGYLRHVRERVNDLDLDDLARFIVVDALSKTEFFDSNKKELYLREFPKEFSKFLDEHPEVRDLDIMKKFIVKNGQILVENAHMEQPAYKEMLMQQLDSLLASEDPQVVQFAKSLFRYSFYKDGLSFHPDSFGPYFSSVYYNTFKDVADKMNTVIPTLNNLNKEELTSILEPFILSNPHLIPQTGSSEFEDNAPTLERGFYKDVNMFVEFDEFLGPKYAKYKGKDGTMHYIMNKSSGKYYEDSSTHKTHAQFDYEEIFPVIAAKTDLTIGGLINIAPNNKNLSSFLIKGADVVELKRIDSIIDNIYQNDKRIRSLNRLLEVVENKYGPLFYYDGKEWTLNYHADSVRLTDQDLAKARTETNLQADEAYIDSVMAEAAAAASSGSEANNNGATVTYMSAEEAADAGITLDFDVSGDPDAPAGAVIRDDAPKKTLAEYAPNKEVKEEMDCEGVSVGKAFF